MNSINFYFIKYKKTIGGAVVEVPYVLKLSEFDNSKPNYNYVQTYL